MGKLLSQGAMRRNSCSLLLHVNTDPRLVLREAAIALRIRLDTFLIMGQTLLPPLPYALVHAQQFLFSWIWSYSTFVRSIHDTAIIAIMTSRRETRCFGPGCDDSLQSTGRCFQRCGRCNIVSYCGRGFVRGKKMAHILIKDFAPSSGI